MNTLPLDPKVPEAQLEQKEEKASLPQFLLSIVPPCKVELVSKVSRQTQPSKTKAELLADGQCEV